MEYQPLQLMDRADGCEIVIGRSDEEKKKKEEELKSTRREKSRGCAKPDESAAPGSWDYETCGNTSDCLFLLGNDSRDKGYFRMIA